MYFCSVGETIKSGCDTNEVERMSKDDLDPRTCYLYFNDTEFKRRYDKAHPRLASVAEEREA